jgi:hypothetical protein
MLMDQGSTAGAAGVPVVVAVGGKGAIGVAVGGKGDGEEAFVSIGTNKLGS